MKQHIVVEKKKEAARWYDNPDISDLMFGMLSLNDEYKDRSVCLHMYDKASKKGVSKVELDSEGKWKPTEIIGSLDGKILYHPILTVGSTDRIMITQMFDNILNGVDFVNGNNGTPACIIIPVVMGKPHYNHFGTIVIKPNANSKETEVYYFNPLGTLVGYKDEEEAIFAYLQNRYAISRTSITHNTTEAWQTDDNQCGPYAIWFVQFIADSVLDKTLGKKAIAERFAQIWKCGVGDEEKTALDVRDNQADFLIEGCNTNFTIPLFLGFKKAVLDNDKWYEKQDELRFANPQLKNAWQQTKKLLLNHAELRDVDGIDTFEAQEETRTLLLQHAAIMPSIHSKPIIESPNSRKLFYQIGFVLGCAATGALAGYCFAKSPNIYALNQLTSCITQSEVAAAVINNGLIGTFAGAFLVIGYEVSYVRCI